MGVGLANVAAGLVGAFPVDRLARSHHGVALGGRKTKVVGLTAAVLAITPLAAQPLRPLDSLSGPRGRAVFYRLRLIKLGLLGEDLAMSRVECALRRDVGRWA